MRVEAQKVPKVKGTTRQMLAQVCYYYNYTLKQASQLPARDVMLLLREARKIEAKKMHNLTQVAAAPHTEKGKGVKRLSEYFSREAK